MVTYDGDGDDDEESDWDWGRDDVRPEKDRWSYAHPAERVREIRFDYACTPKNEPGALERLRKEAHAYGAKMIVESLLRGGYLETKDWFDPSAREYRGSVKLVFCDRKPEGRKPLA